MVSASPTKGKRWKRCAKEKTPIFTNEDGGTQKRKVSRNDAICAEGNMRWQRKIGMGVLLGDY